MSLFFQKNRFVIYSILTIVMVFAVIAKFLVPEGITAVSEFTAIRAEAQKTTLLQDDAKSPDELIANYRKISSQIESRINVEVSASGILRNILETAAADSIQLLDLTTAERHLQGNRAEYPVNFKASGRYHDFHDFVTDLENGIYCLKISSIDVQPGKGNLVTASVRMSILGKAGGSNE